METSPQWPHSGPNLNFDNVDNVPMGSALVLSTEENANTTTPWPYSASVSYGLAVFNNDSFSHSGINGLTERMTLLADKRPMSTLLADGEVAGRGRVVEEDGRDLEPCDSASKDSLDLKRPSPSDWEQWRPIIIAKYKRGTARMILKDMQSAGFDVTEKTLRERLKQWRVNTKNKRPAHAGTNPDQTFNAEMSRTNAMVAHKMTIQRPVATNADDVYQRRLLSTMDRYLECSFARPGESPKGSHFVIIVLANLHQAVLAAARDSSVAWKLLRDAGSRLRQIHWAEIPPRGVVYLTCVLARWGTDCDPTIISLRQLLREVMSSIIGEGHPIVAILHAGISGRLTLDTCRRALAVAEYQAKAGRLSLKEQVSFLSFSRFLHLETLNGFGELQELKDTLDSWMPSRAGQRCYKAKRLADLRMVSKDYHRAEMLYSEALDFYLGSPMHVSLLIDMIVGHVAASLHQDHPADAAEVFSRGVALCNDATHHKSDLVDRALAIDHLRRQAENMYKAFPNADNLLPIIAQLEAMSLEP